MMNCGLLQHFGTYDAKPFFEFIAPCVQHDSQLLTGSEMRSLFHRTFKLFDVRQTDQVIVNRVMVS